LNQTLSDIASFTWWPILFLILGGGIFFLIYSRFVQYFYFPHAVRLLLGKYQQDHAPGQISPYKALSTALASTVGMGNLSGVAAAIALGGPGAIFWMWVTAVVGMSTNFFTSTLSIMYRGKDSMGETQGGPMYVIREALGKPWQPLAVFFCLCCLIGALPIFQANQLTQAIVDIGFQSSPVKDKSFIIGGLPINILKLVIGITATALVSVVIIGGIKRIGNWAGRLVPVMIVLHFVSVAVILIAFYDQVPHYAALIFTDAFAPTHFQGDPFLGGVLGGLIMLGVRRATFSNEAGIGTAPMAMSAATSTEPVQEGLLSMLSPVIDTIISCSLTAIAIMVTGAWQIPGINGITMTAVAYKAAMPYGDYVLLLCAVVFSVSALFSYSYYGRKALSFLVGEKHSRWYDYFYLVMIIAGSLATLDLVLNIIDIAFALMAIPTMITALVLAPSVMAETRSYISRIIKPLIPNS
jgi:alanine or glycine:cation symporter, AGCS family